MRTTTTRRGLAATATAALLLGVTACSGDDDKGEPVKPYAVELSPQGVPSDLKIGVVVSLSGSPDEGAQWREAAEGAEVAAYRYGLGDVEVELVPVDDKGTDAGSEAAVDELVDAGVAGIVMATEGSHTAGGLQRASAADTPVLLPYEASPEDLGPGVWTTGPEEYQVGSAIAMAMEQNKVDNPLLVDAGGGQPPGVETGSGVVFKPGDDAKRIATDVRRRAGLETSPAQRGQRGRQEKAPAEGDLIDSVVVSGPASLQAEVVKALQSAAVDLPVFLSADATSPVFATALADAGGSLASPITTGGVANGDVVALEPGDDGAAVSAWLAAVRTIAEDGAAKDYFDGAPFNKVAGVADARSHDAVIALVSAAAEAQSGEPGQVKDALGDLTLDHADGLAGPGLSFDSGLAMPEEAVVPLQATTQDPGLRGSSGSSTARLFWFRLPKG